jgi:hypothetical protein
LFTVVILWSLIRYLLETFEVEASRLPYLGMEMTSPVCTKKFHENFPLPFYMENPPNLPADLFDFPLCISLRPSPFPDRRTGLHGKSECGSRNRNFFQNPLCKSIRSSPFPIRRAGSPPERRNAAMDADRKAAGADVYDEELRDILIAISVVAKRLATKMEAAVKSETQTSKANERQGG